MCLTCKNNSTTTCITVFLFELYWALITSIFTHAHTRTHTHTLDTHNTSSRAMMCFLFTVFCAGLMAIVVFVLLNKK